MSRRASPALISLLRRATIYRAVNNVIDVPWCVATNLRRVLMGPTLNLAVREAIPPSLVVEKPSPIALAKALKNEHELEVI